MIKVKVGNKKESINELEKNTFAYKALKKIKPDVKAPMSSFTGGAYRKVLPVSDLRFTKIKDESVDDYVATLLIVAKKGISRYFDEHPDSQFIQMEKQYQSADRFEHFQVSLTLLLNTIIDKLGLNVDITERQATKEVGKTLPDGRQVKSIKRFKIVNLLKEFADFLDNPTPQNKSYKIFSELYSTHTQTDNKTFDEMIDELKKAVVSFQETADLFDRNGFNVSLGNDPATIILSRVPVDIMRMSDFSHLESCHSPPYPSRKKQGGQYHLCAIQEARSPHGMIAYLFDKSPNLTPDEQKLINSTSEFMVHKEEGFDSDWNPVARVRIRSYLITNKSRGVNFYFHVPSPTVYGAPYEGFLKTVVEYFRREQKSQIDTIKQFEAADIKLNISTRGGFYHDGTEELVCAMFAEVKQETFQILDDKFENVELEMQERVDNQFFDYIYDKVNLPQEFEVEIMKESAYTYRGETEKNPAEILAVYNIVYNFDISRRAVDKLQADGATKDRIYNVIKNNDKFAKLIMTALPSSNGTDFNKVLIEPSKTTKDYVEIKRIMKHEFPKNKTEIKNDVNEFVKVCNMLYDPNFYINSMNKMNNNQQVAENVYYFKRLAGIIK